LVYHMRMQTFTDDVISTLEALADPVRAAPMRAYMKDHFAYLGIATPQRRAAVTPLLRRVAGIDGDQLLVLANELWLLPRREYQYVALDLLARYWKSLNPDHVEPLLALVQQKSWWDSVDGLASVIGDVLRAGRAREPGCQRRMDLAIEDGNLWVRRVAMLHQNGWRGETDTQRLFAYALSLAPEPDFFIRKAIGWALRDHAHHNPELVRAFLRAQQARLSGLTLREAGKHLGPLTSQ
jgi:3-methyladenine DNA glycosylase AlkD